MMCFKHLVPYALLLPMSSASPIFMFLFAIMLFYTYRPCGYCMVLIAVLFLSTSPSSPFLSISPHPTPSTIDPTLLTYPTRKTWLDLNNGYLFDPMIRAFSTNATTYPERYTNRSPLANAEKGELPDGYVDWRYRGLGFVWDFGWKRTEEGVQWELEDWLDTKRRYGVLDNVMGNDVLDEKEETRNINDEAGRKCQWAYQMFGKLWRKEGSIVGDW